MKELTMEQKALVYDEALDIAKHYHSGMGDDVKCVLEEVFSELRESEDESEDDKIRRALLNTVKYYHFKESPYMFGISKEQVIAWLEKQGEEKPIMIQWQGNNLKEVIDFVGKDKNFEKWFKSFEEYEKYVDDHNGIFKLFNTDGSHYEIPVGAWIVKTPDGYNLASKAKYKQKSAYKVEPKFKVGDYVVGKYISGYISEIRDDCYLLDYQGFPIDKQDNYHLWTIADAKPGDVLAWNSSKCIALFKNIYDEDSFNSYGFVGHCIGTFESSQSYHDIEGVHPATKEQRDVLMKAMADAGYTFDFDKKELKKIHVIDEGKAEMDYCFTKMMNGEKVSPIWSEEDDTFFKAIVRDIENIKYISENAKSDRINWFKSLKERVQPQPKQEWSEKDNRLLNDAISLADECDDFELRDWLKSLKPQNRWKPSDGQMIVLNDIIINGHLSNANERILKSLQEQLKKLRKD